MRASGSKRELSYHYADGGTTPEGKAIPDLPVLWLRIRTSNRTALAPTLVDTGFDGGIYSDDRLPAVFEGAQPVRTETLYALGHAIACQVFKAKAWLIEPRTGKSHLPLGEVFIDIPLRIDDLSENIIVGRALLNSLDLSLWHGTRTTVAKP